MIPTAMTAAKKDPVTAPAFEDCTTALVVELGASLVVALPPPPPPTAAVVGVELAVGRTGTEFSVGTMVERVHGQLVIVSKVAEVTV